jgi:hypothetical protein
MTRVGTLVADFLAASDLDDLADIAGRMTALDDDDRHALSEVLANFGDGSISTQSISNLLMYPRLIPRESRAVMLLRGLLAPADSYLRLAAAAGAADLSGLDYQPQLRSAVVGALLDLVADNSGVVSSRAATSVGLFLHFEDAPEVVVLLEHPIRAVRRNLHNALLDLLGPEGFDDLLDDREVVSLELAARVRDQLLVDGRSERPLSDLQRMLVFSWIPNFCDWPETVSGAAS